MVGALPAKARSSETTVAPGRIGFALVWIDSEGARILRWRSRVITETINSDVPTRVTGTAHVRHDPLVRHGGSGRGQDDAERRRNEHLRAFLRVVADRLHQDDQVEILGTGTVGERLATLLRRQSARGRRRQTVIAVRSDALTARQLAARLRQRLDVNPRRTTVGAYRWTDGRPRRVVEKEPSRRRTSRDLQ
jgi:hypothetical protein